MLVETGESGGARPVPVIVVATSATDKSRTAKLLEKRKDALVAMFYLPDLQSVTRTVRGLADGAGVRLGGDLAERIARAANLDVRLAKSEVEKLALYLDASAQSPQTAEMRRISTRSARRARTTALPAGKRGDGRAGAESRHRNRADEAIGAQPGGRAAGIRTARGAARAHRRRAWLALVRRSRPRRRGAAGHLLQGEARHRPAAGAGAMETSSTG